MFFNFFFFIKMTVSVFCQYSSWCLVNMVLSGNIKEAKSWTLPLSLPLYPSLAPLSYLTERDDRRSGVSVNRAKRWRDGKVDTNEGEGGMYRVQMH